MGVNANFGLIPLEQVGILHCLSPVGISFSIVLLLLPFLSFLRLSSVFHCAVFISSFLFTPPSEFSLCLSHFLPSHSWPEVIPHTPSRIVSVSACLSDYLPSACELVRKIKRRDNRCVCMCAWTALSCGYKQTRAENILTGSGARVKCWIWCCQLHLTTSSQQTTAANAPHMLVLWLRVQMQRITNDWVETATCGKRKGFIVYKGES